MRPSLLDPLFAPAISLPGVGPRIDALIARAVGADGEAPLLRDLLFHLPTGFIDRTRRPPLYEMPPSGTVTVEGTVERIEKPRGADSPVADRARRRQRHDPARLFQGAARLAEEALPDRRAADRQRQGRMVRHAPADPASGLCARRRRMPTSLAPVEPVYRPDRRTVAEGAAARDRRRARPAPRPAGMALAGPARGARLAGFRRCAAARCTDPSRSRRPGPRAPPGSGSPSTSLSRASWRLLLMRGSLQPRPRHAWRASREARAGGSRPPCPSR